ncbi:MAG: tRNA uracil 4-sulfurtransferase ThiI [Candidatus Bathyarchaeia archaeon]
MSCIADGKLWDGILAAYGEIALKSDRVRCRFVSKLKHNIREAFEARGLDVRVRHRWSRILIDGLDDVDLGCRIASRIFGLRYIAPYRYVGLDDLESFMKANASRLLDGAESFAIRVRRTGIHSFTSRDLEKGIGGIVKAASNLRVDLDNPDTTIYVEVHDDECYLYTGRVEAPGGLPLGTSSRVVSLVSGGIDSPVATWLMMKRGCPVTMLFAYFPLGGDESDLRRFLAVARILRDWHVGEDIRIYSYRHDNALKEIRRVADSYTCILCRRMMYRVACRVAEMEGAKAIVTGENLAQVASQTLDNLYVVDEVSTLPVLRPLVGFEKEDSVRIARMIGTYEASITPVSSGCRPVKGCWARPRKPTTRAIPGRVRELESMIDVGRLVDEAVSSLKDLSSLL